MNPLLVNIAIQELPELIAFLRIQFRKQNPTEPTPTNKEVIAAYESALASSLAKDAAWLALHPEPTVNG